MWRCDVIACIIPALFNIWNRLRLWCWIILLNAGVTSSYVFIPVRVQTLCVNHTVVHFRERIISHLAYINHGVARSREILIFDKCLIKRKTGSKLTELCVWYVLGFCKFNICCAFQNFHKWLKGGWYCYLHVARM